MDLVRFLVDLLIAVLAGGLGYALCRATRLDLGHLSHLLRDMKVGLMSMDERVASAVAAIQAQLDEIQTVTTSGFQALQGSADDLAGDIERLQQQLAEGQPTEATVAAVEGLVAKAQALRGAVGDGLTMIAQRYAELAAVVPTEPVPVDQVDPPAEPPAVPPTPVEG